MGNAVKIAISLPGKIAREVESIRKKTGETRSAFIKRAIEATLDERNESAMVKGYVAGYRKMPETTEEIEAAETAAKLLPWEPWK